MKGVILFLLAGGAIAATNVCETKMVGANGKLASGDFDVIPNVPFSTPGGSRVEMVKSTISVVNGRFCIALEPNSTSTPPNTAYIVNWRLNNAAPRTEAWVVPASSSTLGVGAVVVATVPKLPFLVQISQLDGTLLPDGNYCLQVIGGRITAELCQGVSGGLFDSTPGLFDSAGGLFDAH